MSGDVKELLHTAAYLPEEIERLLDPDRPSFIDFDPELGYVLRDYAFRDGMEDTLCAYNYESHGGHRKMINYANKPCRINTYGDSFTQCAQVNDGESWQEILAAHFREPIRNFGVGGYGVYQAYNTAMRIEESDLAAKHVVLNVWDDDHLRNIDAARWIRVGWMHKDLPRGGGEDTYPVHGFPWAHVRYDLKRGNFVELPGLCKKAEDLRELAEKDNFYEIFKDDHVVHLYALSQGLDAPVDYLEELAEEFDIEVDLRDPDVRQQEARKLHLAYGVRSTRFILDNLTDWAEEQGREVMVLLSYDTPTVKTYIDTGFRFDAELLGYLEENNIPYVDCLEKAAEDYEDFSISIDAFLERFYIGRAGAQVFGHYNPHGNFWFAFAIRDALVDWLDPNPPSYR
ncbi:MAG: hypothetical protein KGZ25_06710 [Planctomycetes bacterium]|nr:hypothetical protein [Planctomycetota bacterium]